MNTKTIENHIIDFILWSIEDPKICFERFFDVNQSGYHMRKHARNLLSKIDVNLVNLWCFLNWAIDYPHLPHAVLIDELDNPEWIDDLIKDVKVFINSRSSHLRLVK